MNFLDKLNAVEIKAFLPAIDFSRSCEFYTSLGFTKASEDGGVAYFRYQNCSFLLTDFYAAEFAKNLTIHLLVEDAEIWHKKIVDLKIASQFDVLLTDPIDQPWKMRDFTLQDPSGVCWRIANNLP